MKLGVQPQSRPIHLQEHPSRSTGNERDSETGLDYFGARYYGSNIGRWLSPDWSAAADPIPYADLSNPQTLNLYHYVTNNPIRNVDVDGHDCPPDCGWILDGLKQSFVDGVVGGGQGLANSGIALWNTTAELLNEQSANVAPLNLPVATPYAPMTPGEETAQRGTDLIGDIVMFAGLAGGLAGAETAETGQAVKGTSAPPGENAAAATGRAAHAEFAEKVRAKPGWQSQPRLTDPKTGKTLIPDATSRAGKPVELKPKTPSGRAAGRTKLKKYERAAGKKGRVVYYDPSKRQ